MSFDQKMLLNIHLQQQKDAMKWMYYLMMCAVDDFPVYFADWNRFENVFSFFYNEQQGL